MNIIISVSKDEELNTIILPTYRYILKVNKKFIEADSISIVSRECIIFYFSIRIL